METRFFWPVRVYYEDTDAAGVVYYANYLKFFERARTERLRAIGFQQDQLRASEGVLFAVKTVQADYIKPARFNDQLWVTADVTELKRASLTFAQEIRRDDGNGERLCQASIRIVCLNAEDLRPAPIPDYLLQRIRDEL